METLDSTQVEQKVEEKIEYSLASFRLTFTHCKDSKNYKLRLGFEELVHVIDAFLNKYKMRTSEEIILSEADKEEPTIKKLDTITEAHQELVKLYQVVPKIGAGHQETTDFIDQLGEICSHKLSMKRSHL
jgi:hypothetical protein